MPSIGPIELLLMALFILAALVALMVLGAVTVRGAAQGRVGGARPSPSAKDALDRRYANGEITREEYLTTRDDITRNNDA